MDRRWWTLVGACAGLFLLMLDSTVVALALPSIRHDLDASAEALQWAMNGYLLTIAILVITAGRLGDMSGASGRSCWGWSSSPPARSSPGRPPARRC